MCLIILLFSDSNLGMDRVYNSGLQTQCLINKSYLAELTLSTTEVSLAQSKHDNHCTLEVIHRAMPGSFSFLIYQTVRLAAALNPKDRKSLIQVYLGRVLAGEHHWIEVQSHIRNYE